MREPANSSEDGGLSPKVQGAIQDTGDAIQDTEAALQDTGDAIQDTEAALQDTSDATQDTGDAIQDTEAALQNTSDATQDTGDAIQDTEAALQDTGDAIQDEESTYYDDEEEGSPEDRVASLPGTPGPDAPVVVGEPPAAPPKPIAGPPLLASQALMEDLAPVEPLGRHARILCVLAGALFAAFGALPLLGLPLHTRPALIPSLVVGAVTLFAAIARVTYRKRAVAMLALGAIVAGLGIAGTGPAQGVVQGGALWAVARFVAAAALPASLLFRARYRAFGGARLVLGLAFLLALPYAFRSVQILTGPDPFGITQIGAILALVLLLAGLGGFMGAETTAAGSVIAPAMLCAFALQAGLERLGALVPGSLADMFGFVQTVGEDGQIHALDVHQPYAVTAIALRDAAVATIAFAGSALLSALGLFQILAWKFAPAARQIDVRRVPKPIEERKSIEEWSTNY